MEKHLIDFDKIDWVSRSEGIKPDERIMTVYEGRMPAGNKKVLLLVFEPDKTNDETIEYYI